MHRGALCIIAVLGLSAAAVRAEDTANKKPYELVRELQVFQDQAALKSTGERAEQRERIAKVAEALTKFDASVWAEERNLRGAVIYVLSGGNPHVLRSLIDAKEDLGGSDRLVKGALAYSERRDAEAAELLSGVDVESLDRSVGGHVALVRASLAAESDQRKAFALLDRARVIAPGTLVEEAALRRQAIIAAKMNELDVFERLSSQYFRRFGNSLFAGSFEQQFAREIVSNAYPANEKRMANLEAMVASLTPDVRTDTCLALAEEGISKANVEIVRFAARLARIDANSSPLDATRMRLFEAAALLVTDAYEEGSRALWTIDRSKLGVREEALLNAAFAVAKEIARPPSMAQMAKQTPATGDANTIAESSVISDAKQALERVDGLLNEASR